MITFDDLTNNLIATFMPGASPTDVKIYILSMITHTLTLEKINDGFHMMHEGKSIRSVVLY